MFFLKEIKSASHDVNSYDSPYLIKRKLKLHSENFHVCHHDWPKLKLLPKGELNIR